MFNLYDDFMLSELQRQFDWAMVASVNVVVNGRVLDVLHELLVHHKVVQPPAYILFPAPSPHAPPAVLHHLRVEVSERVHPPIFKELAETVALLNSESSGFLVSFWSSNIDLLMANIQISTPNNSFFLSEGFEIGLHVSVVLLCPVVEALELLP